MVVAVCAPKTSQKLFIVVQSSAGQFCIDDLWNVFASVLYNF
jgi:hypothetical protein